MDIGVATAGKKAPSAITTQTTPYMNAFTCRQQAAAEAGPLLIKEAIIHIVYNIMPMQYGNRTLVLPQAGRSIKRVPKYVEGKRGRADASTQSV